MNTVIQARNNRGILVGITLQGNRLFVNDWFTPHTANRFTDRLYAVSELKSVQIYRTGIPPREWAATIEPHPASSSVPAVHPSEVYTDITENDANSIASWWSEQTSPLQ